jgi:hypothetical protein
MARPSNGRNETPPLTVRVSPAERAALAAKAQAAGMRVSEALRAAMEAWEPVALRRELTLERDPEFTGGE